MFNYPLKKFIHHFIFYNKYNIGYIIMTQKHTYINIKKKSITIIIINISV